VKQVVNDRDRILPDRERVRMVRGNRWGTVNTGCDRMGECEESHGDKGETHGRNEQDASGSRLFVFYRYRRVRGRGRRERRRKGGEETFAETDRFYRRGRLTSATSSSRYVIECQLEWTSSALHLPHFFPKRPSQPWPCLRMPKLSE
jgi:hypothetical protein